MTSLINKMQEAFTRQGNDFTSLLKLAPAALAEMAKLKANGNQLGFIKDPDGRWYADLQNWPMEISHLEMAAGADDLLDELSINKNYITFKISQHKTAVKVGKNEALLTLLNKEDNGLSGTYQVSTGFAAKEVWLYTVINFVFMGVPKYIKFSRAGKSCRKCRNKSLIKMET